jgi:hypothetical protein
MINKELFHQLYTTKAYPSEFEDFLYPIYDRLIVSLQERLNKSNIKNKNIDLYTCFLYLVEEHLFNVSFLERDMLNKFVNDENYKNHLFLVVNDKIFFNEYLEYKSVSIIDKHNPLISTLSFYLNFIINKYEQLPSDKMTLNAKLKLDALKKAFLMTKSVTKLLTQGFETEAFSTWRTIHEVECVAKILHEHPYISELYYKHMEYNSKFRESQIGNVSQEENDIFFAEIKENMKNYDLKSKDMKKYLEYGWLYGVKDWQTNYPEMKLNFRKGVEYVANLTAYSTIYEASSEIAHGSSLLIYSNKKYYCNLTLICLYESFFRMENIFSQIVKEFPDIDSSGYFKMQDIYIKELKKNFLKLKISLEYQNNKKDNNDTNKKISQ